LGAFVGGDQEKAEVFRRIIEPILDGVGQAAAAAEDGRAQCAVAQGCGRACNGIVIDVG
jgi:hypothetical protein